MIVAQLVSPSVALPAELVFHFFIQLWIEYLCHVQKPGYIDASSPKGWQEWSFNGIEDSKHIFGASIEIL